MRVSRPRPAPGAFAELFSATGRLQEAASLLGSSVALNAEKGSPIGLAFNRRALAALSQATVPGPQAEQLRAALQTIENRLSQAETMFGRLVLPGETG